MSAFAINNKRRLPFRGYAKRSWTHPQWGVRSKVGILGVVAILGSVLALAAVRAVGDASAAAHSPSASLSGSAFRDVNADGVRTVATEPGQSGITVNVVCVSDPGADGVAGTADDLYSSAVSTITGANGGYSFAGLPAI